MCTISENNGVSSRREDEELRNGEAHLMLASGSLLAVVNYEGIERNSSAEFP